MLILVTAAAIVVVFVVIVATRPADFSVTRSKTISAPATVVFAQVNDFHNWNAWSPWAKMDLTMKTTYEGPSAGTSASYSWAGNSKVGAGRMTIVESRPSELIRIRLEFLNPFPATNQTEFTFKSQGSQTETTWTMRGKRIFITKAMSLFMDMDKMIGKWFEQGLEQMKTVAESQAGRNVAGV